jgi:hypothetical protein
MKRKGERSLIAAIRLGKSLNSSRAGNSFFVLDGRGRGNKINGTIFN